MQERVHRLLEVYTKSVHALLAAGDLQELVAWIEGWLSPVYARGRLYWYDAIQDKYYGLYSYGMGLEFHEKFNADLTAPLARKYEIPYPSVEYDRLALYPHIKILDRVKLEARFPREDDRPEYYRDIFKSVDQSLTIEFVDPTADGTVLAALSVDLGVRGQHFTHDINHVEEELLLTALLQWDWIPRFCQALLPLLYRQDDRPTPNIASSMVLSHSTLQEVGDKFFERHAIGRRYELSSLTGVRPPENVIVYNLAVPPKMHPLTSVFTLIDKYRQLDPSQYVFIVSHSGCGKGLAARAIHEYGVTNSSEGGSQNPEWFQNLGIGDLAEGTVQIQLAGSKDPLLAKEAGGAVGGRCFLLDDLHHIREMDPKIIPACLPILDGQFRSLGDDVTRPVECRIIVTLNCDEDPTSYDVSNDPILTSELKRRLGKYWILRIPTLEQRRCDIIVATAYYLDYTVKAMMPEVEEVFIEGEALQSLYWGQFSENFGSLRAKVSRMVENIMLDPTPAVTIRKRDIPGLAHCEPREDEKNYWHYWIEPVTSDTRVRLYPWPGRDEKVDPGGEKNSGSMRQLKVREWLEQKNPNSFKDFFKKPVSKDQAQALLEDLLELGFECGKQFNFEMVSHLWKKEPKVCPNTLDDRLKECAALLGVSDAEVKHRFEVALANGRAPI